MKLQKQNQQIIRQSLQLKLFPTLQKSNQINPKSHPKRAIRAEDQPIVSTIHPINQIEKEVETFSKKYTLGPMLGEGAHAIVKLAINNTNQTQVAVKICRSGDPELIATFTDSFKNSRYLNHQFIITVYECYIDQQSETLYLVMEYSAMPSLEQILRVRIKLTEDQSRAIMRSLLTGIKHMHERGIAHRDLKPDNILVQQIKKNDFENFEKTYKEYYPIKIIDLGVSRKFKRYVRHEFTDIDMWTRTGTEFYTAPEIYQGGGYTEKVDLWAVGVTLYLMIAGELPFYDDSVYGTIDLILSGKFNLNHPSFSILAKDLINRLLDPNPNTRLTAQLALQHPWFYFSKKFDPISPNSEHKSSYRASDDIYEMPSPNTYYGRNLHVRSNTITKSPSNMEQTPPSPLKTNFSLQQHQYEEDPDEDQSPLIKLRKIQNQINKEIHVTQKQPQDSQLFGMQRIKLKLSQRELNDKQLNVIQEQEL